MNAANAAPVVELNAAETKKSTLPKSHETDSFDDGVMDGTETHDESFSGFESVLDVDEQGALSNPTNFVSDAFLLQSVALFLREQKQIVRKRRDSVEKARREWRVSKKAAEQNDEKENDDGRTTALCAVRAALDAQTKHYNNDARNLRALKAAAASCRDGASLATAFSSTVITSTPGSLTSAYSSIPSAPGVDNEGNPALHHPSRFRRVDGSRCEQFGDDPLRVLRNSLFTVRRAEQTRADASAVTISMRSHKAFSGDVGMAGLYGGYSGGVGSVQPSSEFLSSVDQWNKVKDKERALFHDHGVWLSEFRANIEMAANKTFKRNSGNAPTMKSGYWSQTAAAFVAAT